ncbi:MAG: hypothetical protein IRZ03_16190 [Acidobacterium ailaaui]|nr:hypothetical protein [Pseudacidobacterium ailaaui]
MELIKGKQWVYSREFPADSEGLPGKVPLLDGEWFAPAGDEDRVYDGMALRARHLPDLERIARWLAPDLLWDLAQEEDGSYELRIAFPPGWQEDASIFRPGAPWNLSRGI